MRKLGKKSTWLIVVALLIVLTIIQIVITNRYSNYCLKINEAVLSSVAIITVVATMYGYSQHKDEERNRLLAKYNEIYRTNDSINSVLEYLISVEEEGTPTIIEDKNSPQVINKRETFLHFIEEIQYLIEKDMLNANEAYDMFGYYANSAYSLGGDFLSEFAEDNNLSNWQTLRRFIVDYNNYKKKG